jgi:hypothetical protein
MFEDWKRQTPPNRRQEFESLFDLAEEITIYQEKHDEIEAAMKTLEDHRTEFEALSKNPAEVMERSQRVFSEEPFRPLRYTAEQVKQAFEVVGYPSNFARPSDKDIGIFRSAILHLTDPDLRLSLSRRLLIRLPEYVAEGRYLDAWLIQYSAFQMREAPEESNPFLFEMFYHGLAELGNQLQAQQEALLDHLGVDPTQIAAMKPAELQSLMEENLSSPEAAAQAEAFFAANPILNEQLQAQFREWEHDALYLLNRDDAEHLRLAPEETAPWLPALIERVTPYEEQARQAEEQGIPVDPQVLKAMQEVFVEVAMEMTPAIFEPGRISQFVAQLKEYQYQLLAGGEKDPAKSTYAAYTTLEREEEPARNRFLVSICYASLISEMITRSEQTLALLEAEERK